MRSRGGTQTIYLSGSQITMRVQQPQTEGTDSRRVDKSHHHIHPITLHNKEESLPMTSPTHAVVPSEPLNKWLLLPRRACNPKRLY